jgi:hypothetical protein
MKKFIIILLAVVAIGLTGCEKWLDVNHNPNSATKATPDLILPGVLVNWCSDVNGLTTTMGAWMGYWAHAGGWSGWYSEKKYEITSSYYPGAFNGYYPGVLTDTKFIRDNSGTNVMYPAITNVVDAWYYSRLVDLYGDVPYTEACNPNLTLTPKYDKGSDIYAWLLIRLDTAIAVFHRKVNAPDAATNAVYAFNPSSDVVYAGDFTKWKLFANTLKLRLIMRQTNVKSVADLKALMDNTVNYGFITASVTGMPGYLASSGKINPLWATFGKSFDNVIQNANTQYILNAYMHQKLIGLSDPRLTNYFFAPAAAAGVLKSFVLGTDGDLVAQPKSTQAANYSWIMIAASAAIGANGTAATVTGALDQQVLFPLSEAQFLQAEAQLRGVITIATTAGATVQASYTAAVTTALTAARVTVANQTLYLAGANVAWDPAATTAAKIERIIDQKWIANYFLNHFESYNDYRRTGFPRPKGGAVNPIYEMLSYYPGGIIRRQIPRLFPYPNEEFTLNKTNALAAVALQNVEFTTSKYPFDARTFWDNAPLTIVY